MGYRKSDQGVEQAMWEISSMENTHGIVIERVHHPELGRFTSEAEAREVATETGENYFPWLME